MPCYVYDMTNERRNYFRMTQRVAMEIKPLDPARATDPSAPLADDGTQRFRLLSELEAMHAESQSLLASLTRRDPELSRYLRLMDRKIRLIAEACVDHDEVPLPDDETEVNLSAGGLSFISQRALERGSYFAVRLLLLPERAGLLLKSRVVRASPKDDHWLIQCEFLHISESDRAVITRHLLQVEQRKRALEIES